MTVPGALRWGMLALLGLAIAVGVAIVASKLTSQKIGLASEPIRAGETLAPASADRDPHPRRSRKQHSSTPATTAPTTTSSPPPTTAPAATNTAPPAPAPGTQAPPATGDTPSRPASDDSGGQAEQGDD